MPNLIVTGYASVFGVKDSVGDIIERGAFAADVGRMKNLPFLFGHNAAEPCGRVLRAEEDWYGLFVTVEIFEDIAKGSELIKLFNNGMRIGLSIGYRATKSCMKAVPDGQEKDYVTTRMIQEAHLMEISFVTVPANDRCMLMKKKKRRKR